jgi:hypothetical protein
MTHIISGSRMSESQGRPLSELRDSGLLWLINRVVFHPRGFGLALHVDRDTKQVVGWSLQGDGIRPLGYDVATEDDRFAAAEQTISESRAQPLASANHGDPFGR